MIGLGSDKKDRSYSWVTNTINSSIPEASIQQASNRGKKKHLACIGLLMTL